jgi:hypothetical protein
MPDPTQRLEDMSPARAEALARLDEIRRHVDAHQADYPKGGHGSVALSAIAELYAAEAQVWEDVYGASVDVLDMWAMSAARVRAEKRAGMYRDLAAARAKHEAWLAEVAEAAR